jgi:hypothetical protein
MKINNLIKLNILWAAILIVTLNNSIADFSYV